MASKFAAFNINELLDCPICMNKFSQMNLPKILPCSHSVCAPCLQGRPDGQTLRCPICHKHKSAQGGVTNTLITNVTSLQLADIQPECLQKHTEETALTKERTTSHPVKRNELHASALSVEQRPAQTAAIRDYTQRGQLVKRLQTWRSGGNQQQFASPRGVAVDAANGEMFVADAEYDQVHVFLSSGPHVRSFGGFGRSPGQFINPCGVRINHSKEVIVCDYGNDRCQMLTRRGKSIRQFGHTGSGKGVLSEPRDVTVDDSDTMYVTSCRNNCIKVYSKDGTYCRSFGAQGSGPGQFKYPDYIQWSRGKCVVCDSNGVHLWSDGGEFICSIGASTDHESLISPLGVIADQCGTILVLDAADHNVKVFSTNGQFVTKFLVDECQTKQGRHCYLSCTPEGVVIMSDCESRSLLFY